MGQFISDVIYHGLNEGVGGFTETVGQSVPAALLYMVRFLIDKARKEKASKEEVDNFEKAISTYLKNARSRYNQVRTLATGPEPRTIIGQDSIYVKVGVARWRMAKEAIPWYIESYEFQQGEFEEVSTNSVDCLLRAIHGVERNHDLLILGTGGAGKSMLMRYLFLTSAREGDYIPILLELRKVNIINSSNTSIPDLIYTSMEDFGVSISKNQFEETLKLGKYLFLFDGLDLV